MSPSQGGLQGPGTAVQAEEERLIPRRHENEEGARPSPGPAVSSPATGGHLASVVARGCSEAAGGGAAGVPLGLELQGEGCGTRTGLPSSL